MGIVMANQSHIEIVKKIVQETIDAIYPKYYSAGAVTFFKSHHNDSNIKNDLDDENVYLLQIEDAYVGTVTKKDNEICRLFVLPEYQHKGYGQQLLDFIENKIKEEYSQVLLDASLPAKKIYKKRGYVDIEYHQIEAENGDVLCYDVMQKKLNIADTSVFSENGEIDGNGLMGISRVEHPL